MRIHEILRESPPCPPTPRTLGVCNCLGCCDVSVLWVSWSLFPDGGRAWLLPACRGGGGAGFPGDGLLGRGGVPEFRACFLGALGVAFPPGDVQGVQRGACGGVRRGGECFQ